MPKYAVIESRRHWAAVEITESNSEWSAFRQALGRQPDYRADYVGHGDFSISALKAEIERGKETRFFGPGGGSKKIVEI